MDTLSGDEELGPLLEAVRITEGHFGQWGTTAGIVDDILGEAANVTSKFVQPKLDI